MKFIPPHQKKRKLRKKRATVIYFDESNLEKFGI
jgi:hypothetical protein